MIVLVVILVLAAGTYAFRVAGVVLGDRLTLSPPVQRLLTIGALTLLAALASTAALTEDRWHAGFARPAGVLVGVVLAWRKAPFVVVVVAAAGTAALLRLLGVP